MCALLQASIETGTKTLIRSKPDTACLAGRLQNRVCGALSAVTGFRMGITLAGVKTDRDVKRVISGQPYKVSLSGIRDGSRTLGQESGFRAVGIIRRLQRLTPSGPPSLRSSVLSPGFAALESNPFLIMLRGFEPYLTAISIRAPWAPIKIVAEREGFEPSKGF